MRYGLLLVLFGAVAAAQIPKFEPDPSWPKPLPNNWMLGQVSGTSVDSHDNVWVIHRPRTLDEHDKYLESGKGDCCVPAPAVIEFDQAGNVVQAWGGPNKDEKAYEWPDNEHGIFVDSKDNVWITGNGDKDAQILKFTKTGKFLLQIGRHGKSGGSNDTDAWMPSSAPSTNWQAVACSADGTKLIAAVKNGPIYTSMDAGVTWISNSIPSSFWAGVGSSADGNKLVAAVSANFALSPIYTLQSTPAPRLNLKSLLSNVALSWTVPSTNFVLQQKPDLSTANWVTLTNKPALNFSNLQDEIVLSPSNSSSFFRLISQ